VAKLLHRTDPDGESYSLVDVNRSGVPLMEIVGEPDLRSPEEARQYLVQLRSILQFLGVSTGNMEEGSFRCDANVSIRPTGTREFLAKVEVKNMNSFRAVYRALEYEVERHRKVLEGGGRLVQETRGWVEERGVTVSQRSKEYAHDYRYFPEPDLPPLVLSHAWVEEIRSRLPELPQARRERFMAQYGLPLYDASLLTVSKALADYFEACLKREASSSQPAALQKRAKTVGNWIVGDFTRLLNITGIEIDKSKTTPQYLVQMLDLVDTGTISGPAAKEVFEEMFHTGKSPDAIVAEKGLTQISDATAIEGMVRKVVAENPRAVADFRSGKQQAITFLVGQVMRATRGRANAAMVNELLKRELEG
jgi:aspartyl-tRNA(Asn)/glutamyl-tRNA(Gln) amidotransferase subunit B